MLRIQKLTSQKSDAVALQGLLEDATAYSEITTGLPVAKSAAFEMLSAIPPGKTHEDKFVFGFFADKSLVGCADVIRGYPKPDIAFIGLLLVGQSHERQGYGREVFGQLCNVIKDWGTCSKLRLGIIETNHKAKRFWSKLAFTPTGECKPYNSGTLQLKVILHERSLAAEA